MAPSSIAARSLFALPPQKATTQAIKNLILTRSASPTGFKNVNRAILHKSNSYKLPRVPPESVMSMINTKGTVNIDLNTLKIFR